MADELSQEHQEYFRHIFHDFDLNGDGDISKQELKMVLVAIGQNFSQNKIDEILNQVDKDSNGHVDCEQFLHLMSILMKYNNPSKEFSKAFKIYDRDGNGSISAGQLKQVMINLGNQLTSAQIDEIFKNINKRGKQQIDQQQFIRLLMQRDLD